MDGSDLRTATASAKDVAGPRDHWETIPWDEVEAHVSRLQTRISVAAGEGRVELVRRLQRRLVGSLDARLLAVRAVTTNRGRNTPGIDGALWKTPASKLRAAKALTPKGYRARPLRRVNIPKRGKPGRTRPLGIPTMADRAMQALWALALDPVAERAADRNSYGFRRGRCAQDACAKLFNLLSHVGGPEWVLEGDIKGCFDHISHDWLLRNVPMDKGVLAQFLRAGYMEQGGLHETWEGTPQGGVISPILANLALDGMEGLLAARFTAGARGSRYSDRARRNKVHLVRYADDFVVTAATPELASEAMDALVPFLAERGLELSREKTLVTHMGAGFDFLGWSFRKFDGKVIVQPSKAAVRSFVRETHRTILRDGLGMGAEELVRALSPKVRGFANYHRHTCASAAFSKIRHAMHLQLVRWACRRHPRKSKAWVRGRYWHTVGGDNNVFGSGDRLLPPITWFHIVRHPPVRTDMNPYVDHQYFASRRSRLAGLSAKSYHLPAAVS